MMALIRVDLVDGDLVVTETGTGVIKFRRARRSPHATKHLVDWYRTSGYGVFQAGPDLPARVYQALMEAYTRSATHP